MGFPTRTSVNTIYLQQQQFFIPILPLGLSPRKLSTGIPTLDSKSSITSRFLKADQFLMVYYIEGELSKEMNIVHYWPSCGAVN